MPKLPLNQQINSIRNVVFSQDKNKDYEIKKEMISIFKNKIGYKKDEDAKKLKRERREKVRDLAGDDPEKIKKLKNLLYDSVGCNKGKIQSAVSNSRRSVKKSIGRILQSSGRQRF